MGHKELNTTEQLSLTRLASPNSWSPWYGLFLHLVSYNHLFCFVFFFFLPFGNAVPGPVLGIADTNMDWIHTWPQRVSAVREEPTGMSRAAVKTTALLVSLEKFALHPILRAWLHAKSFQSCLTLCDPMDCSPQDSPVHGILQARIDGKAVTVRTEDSNLFQPL